MYVMFKAEKEQLKVYLLIAVQDYQFKTLLKLINFKNKNKKLVKENKEASVP